MRLLQMIIVEDEPMIRSCLVKNIDWKELGFEVVGAFDSGAEAIDFLARAQVEVVFTEIATLLRLAKALLHSSLLPASFCFAGIQSGIFPFAPSRAGFREGAGGDF